MVSQQERLIAVFGCFVAFFLVVSISLTHSALSKERSKRTNPVHPRLPLHGEYILPVYHDDSRIKKMYETPVGFSDKGRVQAPTMKEINKHLKNYPCDINEEVRALKRVMAQAKELKEPIFPINKGSQGIIISVPMSESHSALTSVDLLINYFHVSCKIELWINEDGFSLKQKEYLKAHEDIVSVKYFDSVMDKVFSVFGPVIMNDEWFYRFIYKVAALIATEFDEVLMLDSDSIPFRDLTEILNHPLLKKHGALFWFDRAFIPSRCDIWSILGITSPGTETQDTSMIALRKSDCWRTLYVTLYMNINQRFFYTYVWGDKDTFFLSFILMNQDYVFVPGQHGIGGVKASDGSFAGDPSIMRDPEGRALYVHGGLCKKKERWAPAIPDVHLPDNVNYHSFYNSSGTVYVKSGFNDPKYPGVIEYKLKDLISIDIAYIDEVHQKMIEMSESN